jgi:hypothetical protein
MRLIHKPEIEHDRPRPQKSKLAAIKFLSMPNPFCHHRLRLTEIAGMANFHSQSGLIAGWPACESRRQKSFRLFCSPDVVAAVAANQL